MTSSFAQLRAVAKQICHLCDNYGDAKEPTVQTVEEVPRSQRGPWAAICNNLAGYGETPEAAVGQLIQAAWECLRKRKTQAEEQLTRCTENLEAADAWTGNVR